MSTTKDKTIFEQIGGKQAVEAAVGILYEKIQADKELSPFFEHMDMKSQHRKMTGFITYALGGNSAYKGKTLSRAHEKLVANGLDETHFNAVAGHLMATLKELNVPKALSNQILAIVAGTKNDVLGINKKTMSSKIQNGHSVVSNTSESATTNLNSVDFLQVIEGSVMSIVMINERGDIQYFNRASEKLWGYDREEVIGKNVKMLTPPEIQVKHDGYLSNYSRTGNKNVMGGSREVKALRKDGSLVDVLLALSESQTNGETQYTAFVQDISEKKRLEREAEMERQINYARLHQAVDSVITINADKEITFINPAAERMFGYSAQEAMGQNVKMLVPMEHRGNHDRYVDSNIKTSVNKVVGQGRDLEMTRRDGERFWGNLSLSKIDVDGEIQYTAFIKDITATKHNELAYQEVIKAISELNVGNFNFDLNIGDLEVAESVANVVQDLESLRSNLKEIILEVSDVVKQAGEQGNLNARLKLTDAQGSWKELINSVNILLQSIAEPVLEFNTIITEMSKGDLSRTFEMKTEGDLRNMADSLNSAIQNLNELLTIINENANTVAIAANGSVEKVESMKSNTDEMASAISQMAKGAQDQAQKTDESSKLAEQVLESSGEMEAKSDIINKAAEDGVKSCEEGLNTIKRLVENMTGINSSAGTTSESIKILTERAQEIGRTLNVITDIAAQTNLLALNAAIEAARAGDAGRGFAVVAEEIRKLAEDSRKSAVDIEKIIGDVQKDTQAASKAIETMSVSVKEGSSATQDAEKIFEKISLSSQETLQLSKSIKEESGLQRRSIETVVKNIEQIVVVAEETAAGTEEIATSSAALNSGMEEVATSGNQLTRVAASLQEGISKFKLK